ncbi:fibronectin type III domain-containing protein 4-like isoform X2 [Entelurus aequoreus]|uniref:fibronectin type III domain-containing protein 4-like isoform X2 n=1 Tax=Entelurus aequoreus TaxID=161455 RepID=UPI002B1DD8BB|nr:fibronectin type III domain-containing protein 4-like isoform X2 [Entelurus aequoreus]
MPASSHLDPAGLVLLLLLLGGWAVGGTVPAAPVNVSVTQLRAHSAMVTWNVPQGDTVIGYSISQQVQSVGPHGDSQPSRALHFRTLERSDHYPAGVLDHHEPAMEGLGMTPHLQTGELLIITTVLLLWAAVIALFCRQYEIIKDNDSSGTREKTKRPLVQAASSYYNASAPSSPIYHNGDIHSGRLHRASSSISIIRV